MSFAYSDLLIHNIFSHAAHFLWDKSDCMGVLSQHDFPLIISIPDDTVAAAVFYLSLSEA